MPHFLTIPEAAIVCRKKAAWGYEQVRQGRWEPVKIGSQMMMPRHVVMELAGVVGQLQEPASVGTTGGPMKEPTYFTWEQVPLICSVPEAADVLRCSDTKVRDLLARKFLAPLPGWGDTVISKAELRRYLGDTEPSAGATSDPR